VFVTAPVSMSRAMTSCVPVAVALCPGARVPAAPGQVYVMALPRSVSVTATSVSVTLPVFVTRIV